MSQKTYAAGSGEGLKNRKKLILKIHGLRESTFQTLNLFSGNNLLWDYLSNSHYTHFYEVHLTRK